MRCNATINRLLGGEIIWTNHTSIMAAWLCSSSVTKFSICMAIKAIALDTRILQTFNIGCMAPSATTGGTNEQNACKDFWSLPISKFEGEKISCRNLPIFLVCVCVCVLFLFLFFACVCVSLFGVQVVQKGLVLDHLVWVLIFHAGVHDALKEDIHEHCFHSQFTGSVHLWDQDRKRGLGSYLEPSHSCCYPPLSVLYFNLVFILTKPIVFYFIFKCT